MIRGINENTDNRNEEIKDVGTPCASNEDLDLMALSGDESQG